MSHDFTELESRQNSSGRRVTNLYLSVCRYSDCTFSADGLILTRPTGNNHRIFDSVRAVAAQKTIRFRRCGHFHAGISGAAAAVKNGMARSFPSLFHHVPFSKLHFFIVPLFLSLPSIIFPSDPPLSKPNHRTYLLNIRLRRRHTPPCLSGIAAYEEFLLLFQLTDAKPCCFKLY